MKVIVLGPVEKILKKFPSDVTEKYFALFYFLEKGETLGPPVSKPMPIIGSGVHELRIKGRSGEYRIIYFLKVKGVLHIIHAFQKKTYKTPQMEIEISRKRYKDLFYDK